MFLISELRPIYIRHVQCNVSCSQYISRCECIFHDIEKERNREGEKQSWRLHWELRAIVALSCPESTFDNNSYIFKALLQARIRLNSTLRTVVPLTMFDNIQVRYGYCLMQQKCTQMQTWDLSNILHNQIFGPKILYTKKTHIATLFTHNETG